MTKRRYWHNSEECPCACACVVEVFEVGEEFILFDEMFLAEKFVKVTEHLASIT